MDTIAMIIKGKTQPGKREELRATFERILAPRARENEKQLLVMFCADSSDPDAFVLVEAYADMAAVQQNGQAPWFAEYMAAAMPLLAGQPDVTMASPRWSKGLALK